MKALFTLAFLTISSLSWSQAPEKMTYQAVIRDAANLLVVNQTIGTQISIIQNSPTGNVVYVEVQTPQSNDNGLVSIEIGTGQVISGSFSSIDWGDGPYYLTTESDITGGMNYTITGTTQLLSVPYALYAESVKEVCPEDSMGIFSEIEDPVIPPTVSLAGIPGIVDNRYYKYKYLFKKNDTRTMLSPESSVIQVIDNTIDGQIDFSVQVPSEQDIDSIVIYRQFSVDNIVFGLYSLVESLPVTPSQTFSFTDNYDNFAITPNPQPLADTNDTFLKGIIKTDLLSEDKEYQLPDESGVLALASDNEIIPLSFTFSTTSQTITVNHSVGKIPKMVYLNTFRTVSTPAISGSNVVNDYPASYIKIGSAVVSSGAKPFQIANSNFPNSNITSVVSDNDSISVTVTGTGTIGFTVTGYAVF